MSFCRSHTNKGAEYSKENEEEEHDNGARVVDDNDEAFSFPMVMLQ